MSIAAFRDRATGLYPLTDTDVRLRFDGGLPLELTAEEFDLLDVDPVEAAPLPDYTAEQTISEGEPQRIGDVWRQIWTVTALPPVELSLPLEIADWQFATILAEDGIISQDEAEDFCGAGILPAALSAAIDAIPDETVRKRTRIKVRGAKVYVRTDPATLMLAGILGYAGEAVEDIWRRGAAVA